MKSPLASTPNPSTATAAGQHNRWYEGPVQAPQLSGTALLAAALLLVCQGGGGHGVGADPPAATRTHRDQ